MITDAGYITILNEKYTYFQDGMDFYVLPVSDTVRPKIYRYVNKSNYGLSFSTSIEKECEICVNKAYPQFNESMRLNCKYISKRINKNPICGFILKGDEIDEFFSPIHYYYREFQNEHSHPDLLYSSSIIDNFNFNYDNQIISVSLKYGDILSRGIVSDLQFHPYLEIEFSETNNSNYIYNIFSIIKKTMQFFTRKQLCNFRPLELLQKNQNGDNVYAGKLYDSIYLRNGDPHSSGLLEYLMFKDYISTIMQIIADDKDFSITHLSLTKADIYDYSHSSRFNKIFTAFEHGCHCDEQIYEVSDKNYSFEKCETIKALHASSTYSNLSAEYKKLLENRINQLGHQRGQRAKICNATIVLTEYLKNSISGSLLEYQNEKSVIETILDLRQKVVHNSADFILNNEEQEAALFLDVIQLLMILKKAKIPVKKTDVILSALFRCNTSYFDYIKESNE